MSEPLLLGIDIGTTRVKVGAFHLDGRAAALTTAHYPYPLRTAGEGAEQDATDWLLHLHNALRETLAGINPSALLGLCIGGQGPTLVALDQTLQPVAPALTWLDRRAAEQARQLAERAQRPIPSHALLAKVLWLAEERPDVYARTRWFCQAWDFVAMRLTGSPLVSTSPGIAPWDDGLLAQAGMDSSKFPDARTMGELLGYVSVEAARATGLPQGLPVVGGISDYLTGILGSGAVTRGIACDNGGTSTSFNVCWDAPLNAAGLFCLPSFIPDHWYIGGPTSTSGRALDWWRKDILRADAGDWTMVQEAREIRPGSEQLIFLPYLAGERAPLWDAQARGVFFGLGLNHTRAHMTRALLEAVAYSIHHIAEQVERAGAVIDEIYCCGGQAASSVWCAIKADVTGKRVVVPQVIEAAVLGAAVIAGVGVGAFGSFADGARRMIRTRAVIEPDAERHAQYQESYLLYRELYPALKPLYGRG